MVFLEASAKDNHNVQEIFQTVASEICRVQAKGQGIRQRGRQERFNLNNNNTNSSMRRCIRCVTTWNMHRRRLNPLYSEVTSRSAVNH